MTGELMLVQRNLDKPHPKKLRLFFIGPHEALCHYGNTVKCRQLGTYQVSNYPVTRITFFTEALKILKAAEKDHDQSQVRAFTAWELTLRSKLQCLSASSLPMVK